MDMTKHDGPLANFMDLDLGMDVDFEQSGTWTYIWT